MQRIVEITYEDIEALTDKQLTDLLRMLLYLETITSNIPSSSVGVSLKINVSDGGEDARIKWDGGPSRTNWIPQRLTLFQCKATDMSASECKKEICLKNSNQLKNRVEEVLDAGGTYLLFYGRNCNTEHQQPRISAIREAIREAGKAYYDTIDIQIYDANKIASWANHYIPSIISVCNFIGRKLPNGFQTWSMWEGYQENKFNYVEDETLKGYKNQLKEYFNQRRKVARIVGLSGLGKTRLAFEAFRPPQNPEEDLIQQALSEQVVYLDAASFGENLLAEVSHLRSQKLSGILIVDNCDVELHELLQREITHDDSQLSLLTLDYNPEQKCSGIPFIRLTQVSDSVIKNLIIQAFPGLIEADVSRIVEFAQGFPQMAVLLAEARLKDETDIGSLNNDVLVEKLIWGNKNPNLEAFKVISACSLFEHLGYAQDVVDQRQFVASKICNQNDETFYGFTQVFIKRGILDRRHRFIRVVPRPLAIRLAADWWSKCPPERAKELLMEDMPAGMPEALCAQMAMLHFLPEAQEAVSDLCGNQAPFGQAEVLNSEKGSRLFRYLVEVNPQATVKALELVFDGWSREQLLQVGPGRRNLVWALEKLCFWEDTFKTASRIMLAFAAAENESWGNNATNQFLQLFHIYLSGTQAPPKLRLNVIDEALSNSDTEVKKIGIKALGHVLWAHHFSRTGGVESQGSRAPQEDWKPKTWGEAFNYWRESLTRLTPIACGNDDLANLAREQIVDSIRGLVQYGQLDEIEKTLITICEKRGFFWPEAFKKIQEAIRFEGPKIPEEGKERLIEWIKRLTPKSIAERMKLLVSYPSWDHIEDEEGNFIDVAEREAIAFAEECSKDITPIIENLSIIFEGEQRKGYVFGHTLGNSLGETELFISKALSILSNIDSTKGNSIVLGGFLAALNKKSSDKVKEVLDFVVQDSKLHVYAIDLIRLIEPSKEDLDRVITLLKDRKIKGDDLRAFAYGSVLAHQKPEVIIDFCEEIISTNSEAMSAAFEIIYMYSYGKPDKLKVCISLLRKIILSPGLLSNISTTMDSYRWQEIVKLLLNLDCCDDELAKHISNEFLDLYSRDRVYYELERSIMLIVNILLNRYSHIIWPILSEGLMSDNWRLKFNLTSLLSPNIRSEVSSTGIVSALSNEFLIEWCKANPEKGPKVLSQIIPVLIKDDKGWGFHPLALFLFNNFGDREDVLSGIYRNMGPSSWSGSIVPYYEHKIEALEKIILHDNPNVSTWAKKIIEALKKEIISEKQREEEEEIGVYRWR